MLSLSTEGRNLKTSKKNKNRIRVEVAAEKLIKNVKKKVDFHSIVKGGFRNKLFMQTCSY